MMDALRAGEYNCVIVKDLSRFGRNYITAGHYLEEAFPCMRVRFIALGDDIDSYLKPGNSNTILLPFKNLINDEYSRDISNKIRASLDMKRRRGDFIGSTASYGYKKSPENKNRLVIDPKTADVVREIYSLYLAGTGKAAIARRLNARGIPSPAAVKRGGVGLWSFSSVDRVLRNRIYTGDMVQSRYGNISYKLQKTRAKSRDEWITVEDTHEAIISPADFQRAQELMSADTRAASTGELSPLAGLVRCADCGRALSRRSVRQPYGTYHYYYCPTYRQSKTACTKHAVRADYVEREVLDAIRDEISAAVDFRKLSDEVKSACQRRAPDTAALKRALSRVMELKRGAYSDWKSGELSREEYTSFKEGYDRDEAALRRQIADALRVSGDTDEPWLRLGEIAMPEKLERGLAAALIKAVRIREGGDMEIEFRFRRPMPAENS